MTPVATHAAAWDRDQLLFPLNCSLSQWRSVGYRRQGRTAILPPRKSEMPDGPLSTPSLLPLLIAVRGGPPFPPPTCYATDLSSENFLRKSIGRKWMFALNFRKPAWLDWAEQTLKVLSEWILKGSFVMQTALCTARDWVNSRLFFLHMQYVVLDTL